MRTDRNSGDSEHYGREAITRLFELQLRAGSTVKGLGELAKTCIAAALRDVSGAKTNKGLDMSLLGSVLRTWHKETKYLTREGLPRSLGIDGRFGLRSLICTYYPRGKFGAVFSKLRDTGLIEQKSDERWAPTARHARISELSEETLAHLSEGVARFVETVTKNAAASSKDELLFERCCKVTKLPIAEASAFREFVRQQAFTFLISVDDWLESKGTRPQKTTTETCTAGVFTFAYLDDALRGKRDAAPKTRRMNRMR